jgi:hypothetical protein
MQDAVLDLIIEIQEWAVARPDLEGTKMAVSLEQEVKILMETEHDQGESPVRTPQTPVLLAPFLGAPIAFPRTV